MTKQERLESVIEWMKIAPPAQWVQEMHEHYQRTGEYRVKDIRRVIGDPTQGVKFVSDSTAKALELKNLVH